MGAGGFSRGTPRVREHAPSCCGARCAPWRRCTCVAHRPRPLAPLPPPATGSGRVAPPLSRFLSDAPRAQAQALCDWLAELMHASAASRIGDFLAGTRKSPSGGTLAIVATRTIRDDVGIVPYRLPLGRAARATAPLTRGAKGWCRKRKFITSQALKKRAAA